MPNGRPPDDATINKTIADLTYASYKYNRNLTPHIHYERWEIVYGKGRTLVMERRYQEELKASGGDASV